MEIRRYPPEVTLPRPAEPDALRPTADAALAAWAARVEADHEQVERCREVADPTDFYAPVATRFRDRESRGARRTCSTSSAASPAPTTRGSTSARAPAATPCRSRSTSRASSRSTRRRRCSASSPTACASTGSRTSRRSRPAGRPTSRPGTDVDVALMAHVGYDIGAIGPFLDAAEAAARRLCIAVMGEGAMTTVATLFWEPVHGEPRVALPALPELVALLFARGCLPEVSLTRRAPPTFPTLDELVSMARRQLWVRPGSPKDARLEELVRAQATERAGAGRSTGARRGSASSPGRHQTSRPESEIEARRDLGDASLADRASSARTRGPTAVRAGSRLHERGIRHRSVRLAHRSKPLAPTGTCHQARDRPFVPVAHNVTRNWHRAGACSS